MSPSFKDFMDSAQGFYQDAKGVVMDANDKFCAKVDEGKTVGIWGAKLEYATVKAIECFDSGVHEIGQELYCLVLSLACESEGAHESHVDRVHRLLTHIESKTPEEDQIEISRERIVEILKLRGENNRREALEIFIAQTFPHIVNPTSEFQQEPV